jgi:ankyrin repeat protein
VSQGSSDLLDKIMNSDWLIPSMGEQRGSEQLALRQLWECIAKDSLDDVKEILKVCSFFTNTNILENKLSNKVNCINLEKPGVPTPLMAACFKGSTSIVEFLLQQGANTEITNLQDASALNMAASSGHAQVMQLLLQHGAKVNHQNCLGMTTLHDASWQNQRECVEVLLKHPEIDVSIHLNFFLQLTKDIKDVHKNTALHLACSENVPQIVDLLLRYGSNVNELGTEGEATPLIVASAEGQIEVVEVLMKYGADINIKDKDGKTAIWWAATSAREDIIRKILSNEIKTG